MPYTIQDGENSYEVSSLADLDSVPVPALLATYNSLTGKSTKKFASAVKGREQTFAAIEKSQEVAPEATPVFEEAPAAPAVKRGRVINFAPLDVIKGHRAGTKRARVIELLSAEGGTTFADVSADIGWDEKTTYEGIRLLHFHLGYGISTDVETGKIVLVGEPTPKPVAEVSAEVEDAGEANEPEDVTEERDAEIEATTELESVELTDFVTAEDASVE